MSIIADQQAKHREAIKEAFFAAGNQILRPVVQTLNEEYPLSKRKNNNPQFDQEIFDKHDEKFKRARNHLYEQRNLVQRKWLPRYIISTGVTKDEVATAEMRSLIVEGALDRLYETLGAYIPMFVQVEHAKPLLTTLGNVYKLQSKQLSEFMANYSATYADGVESMEKELD